MTTYGPISYLSLSVLYADHPLHILRLLLAVTVKTKIKLNSVAFSPQANYTYRATAACWRS
jgi:hypothetical protein